METNETPNFRQYVGAAEGMSLFPELGEVLRISQVYDVVFIYAQGHLLQYQGMLMGWRLYKATPMSILDAKNEVIKWFE